MKRIFKFFVNHFDVLFTNGLMIYCIWIGNTMAAIAWFCVLMCEIKIKVSNNFTKALEEDRDMWWRKFIEFKYGTKK